jgi:predicted phage tail protein
MMRTIVLHGQLRSQFGKSFQLDVKTISEAVRALCCQLPGLRQTLSRGHYRVRWYGKGKKVDLPKQALKLNLGEGNIHIAPVVVGGAISSGVWFLIAGAILVAAAFVFSPALGALLGEGGTVAGGLGTTAFSIGTLGSVTYGNIASLGFGLMLLGAGQLLAPQIQSSQFQESMFAVPENNTNQGVPVPLIYGTFLVGSVTISTALIDANVPIGENFSNMTFVVPGKGGFTAGTNQLVPTNQTSKTQSTQQGPLVYSGLPGSGGNI